MNGIHSAMVVRVATEPERRYLASGKNLLSFSCVVDEGSHQTQARPEPLPATWVKVTLWSELANEMEPVLKKGGSVFLEGRLRLDRWSGSDGQSKSGLSLSAWSCTLHQLSKRGQDPAPEQRQAEWAVRRAAYAAIGGSRTAEPQPL